MFLMLIGVMLIAAGVLFQMSRLATERTEMRSVKILIADYRNEMQYLVKLRIKDDALFNTIRHMPSNGRRSKLVVQLMDNLRDGQLSMMAAKVHLDELVKRGNVVYQLNPLLLQTALSSFSAEENRQRVLSTKLAALRSSAKTDHLVKDA